MYLLLLFLEVFFEFVKDIKNNKRIVLLTIYNNANKFDNVSQNSN